jgi:multisubunit Na+/H+ antiporter MnhG subunit
VSPESARSTPATDQVNQANQAALATPRPGFVNSDQPCEKCGYLIRNSRAICCPECGFIIPRPIKNDAQQDLHKSKVAIWSRFHFLLCLLASIGIVLVFVFFTRVHAISLIRAVVVSLLFLAPILNLISWHRTRPRCFKWTRFQLVFMGTATSGFSALIIWMTVRLVLLS